MDKETYDALQTVMTFARRHGADEEPNHDAFMRVLDWMHEVEKDYEPNDKNK
jgi:hypothetical protein